MICERLDFLAAAAGGQLVHGRPDMLVKGLFTDTRLPVRGALFVALRGERFDGNTYARTAVKTHGAAAVLVDDPEALHGLPDDTGAILVSDSRAGYLGIAAAHRRKLARVRWFGVTGSVGKSTTKEMLSHILASCTKWDSHKAKGSFNNAVGLSHTILGVSAAHDAAVLELGSNHPGEIRQLAAVARPTIALITCAAASHLEAFGTVDNVALEKGEILLFQGPDDTAVLNADSPYLNLWRAMARGNVITFGAGNDANVRAKGVRVNGDATVDFLVRYGDAIADCNLCVPGTHLVANALAAIAAAAAAGIPLGKAAHALSTFQGVARRLNVASIHGVTLIDDTYNANPPSFAAALETLKALAVERKFVVAGDMLELGPQAEELHRELGRDLADCSLCGLITVGELASIAGSSAVGHGLPNALWTHCATPEAAAHALRQWLSPGDAVLVKGSHGIHLERCCELLMKTSTRSLSLAEYGPAVMAADYR